MDYNLSNETINELKRYGGDLLTNIVQSLLCEPTAIASVITTIKDSPVFISNSIFMMKYEKFLNGIYDKTSDTIKISSKLFGEDNKERIDNAIRVITIIDKIDTLTKIEYLLNANRAFCNGIISREDLFRIMNAISNTLSEDLEYLKKHAIDNELFGNANIHSLANIGAVILAGIDDDSDVEKQTYVVTKFGRLIDQYALSVMDDDRQKYYKEKLEKQHIFSDGKSPITTEEIDQLI